MRSALDPIFYPRSIAIVGASRDPLKRGFRSIKKLLDDGFEGDIYPVNPNEREILGLAVYPTLAAIPGSVELALVCTPAATLPDVMEACGAKGVKGAVVLAGGLAEAGAAGQALQTRMVEAARRGGVRIVGPNTSGIFNTHARSNLVGFAQLKAGGIGILAQSGNVALALVTEAQTNGNVGLSSYVGVGNEADLRFDEYLDYFHADERTEALIVYLEGARDGQRLLEALRRIARDKPVLLYKSARSGAGQGAARSHTGALAGDYALSAGVLRQAGAILVRRSDEILALAEALTLQPPIARSRRVAVLADGGGHATIAADALTECGLVLAVLGDGTKQALAALLPAGAALANPVDVAGGTDANPAVFADCARLLLADPAVDALLITGLFGGYGVRFSSTLTEIELDTSRRIAALQRACGKPVLVHSLYAELQPRPLALLRELGIPVQGSLETTVRGLHALAERGALRERPVPVPARSPERTPRFAEVLARCRRERRSVVLEHEARSALEEAGIALPPAIVADTPEAAVAAFERLGGVPVALKIVSRDIVHKTEAGGVELGLRDADGVRRAFARIVGSGQRHVRQRLGRELELAGLLVTPMAPAGGVEVIVGMVRDPGFGPVLMVGLGGVLVELLKDVAFRSLPITHEDADSMLAELRAGGILDGARGAPGVDRKALVRLMLAVCDLCTAFPEIAELDLNPVLAHPDSVSVLDARILLDPEALSQQPNERLS